MTRIDFYHYADDKLRYACRLAATVAERDSRLVVFAPDERVCSAFDRLLWTFQSTRFVPHCRATDPIAGQTPVILVQKVVGPGSKGRGARGRTKARNLGGAMPALGFSEPD